MTVNKVSSPHFPCMLSVLVTCCYLFCSFPCLACFLSHRILLLFSIVKDCDNSFLWKQLLCNCNFCSTGLLVLVRQCTRRRRVFLIIIQKLMLLQCSLCGSLVRRWNRLKMKFRIVSSYLFPSSLPPFLSFSSLAKLIKNLGTCHMPYYEQTKIKWK